MSGRQSKVISGVISVLDISSARGKQGLLYTRVLVFNRIERSEA